MSTLRTEISPRLRSAGAVVGSCGARRGGCGRDAAVGSACWVTRDAIRELESRSALELPNWRS